MAIALDQSTMVLHLLSLEVKGLDRYEPGDPAPYVNLRPWGVLRYLTHNPYTGDDPHKKQEWRELEQAIKWTLKDLEQRGEITIFRDPDGWMAGVWLGEIPRARRARGKIVISDREVVLERDGWACVLCGAGDDLTIDHIFPVAHGGSDAPVNLRVLCRTCNSRKGADIPDEIRFLGRDESG